MSEKSRLTSPAIWCVEFPQVQDTNLGEIAHAVKAVIIIVRSVHVNLSTHFVP